MRTILVGDVQGCYAEQQELLDKCKARPEDWVIFLGDTVDRGPESGKCVDLAMRIEARQGKPACILGNHEHRHLDHEDVLARTGKLPSQLPPSHVVTRSQLRPEHYDYFRRLPLYLRLPEFNAVAVHAGVFPGVPIERQSVRHLTHIQCICPYDFGADGQMRINDKSMWPSRIPPNEGWRFWHHFWDGPERIFFGHSVLNRPLITPKAVGLDGGCCFGGELWAYVLPDERLVSVKARAVHSGESRFERKLFPIGDDVYTY